MNLSNFPNCLIRRPNPDSKFNQWVEPHNLAIQTFALDGPLDQNERAILSLAKGINDFIDNRNLRKDSDYYGNDIVRTLAGAFTDALNYELGRLDGGTLSTWICETVKEVTGEDL